jgi:hypothetical protein
VLLDEPAAGRDSLDRNTLGQMPGVMPWLARVGILRLTGTPRRAGREPAVQAFINRPDHLTRAASELARWDDTLRLTDEAALAATRVHLVAAELPVPLNV